MLNVQNNPYNIENIFTFEVKAAHIGLRLSV